MEVGAHGYPTVEYLVTGNAPKPSAADEALDKIQAVISQYRMAWELSLP
jgi:hypothetical protein